MKNLRLILLLVLFFSVRFASAEQITITTYYPAPYGVYSVLRLQPGSRPAGGCLDGQMYYDNGLGAFPRGIYICNSAAWQSFGGGLWAANVNDIYNTNSGDVQIRTNLWLPRTTTAPAGIIYVDYPGAVPTTKRPFIHTAGGSDNNTFMGRDAGNYSGITGVENTGVGAMALSSNVNGVANTAVGSLALQVNTSGSSNTAIGRYALLNNTVGSDNTAIGEETAASNLNGFSNTAVGRSALLANTSGAKNTAVGNLSLVNILDGNDNVAVGLNTLMNNYFGSNNTALGSGAGANNTGSNNVFLGYQAGYNETLSNRLYIANSSTNTPLIYGDFANNRVGINTASPGTTLAIGSLATTAGGYSALKIDGATGNLYRDTSSARYKENIKPLKNNFFLILKAEPKIFKDKASGKQEIGYIAEEFDKEGLKDLVIYDKNKQPDGIKYDKITLYLIEIVKNQQKEIAELKQRIEGLK